MDKKSDSVNKIAIKKYKIVQNEKFGRYIIAAKNLSAGEVIIRQDALAVGPAIFNTNILCFACMRPIYSYLDSKTRYSCSKCKIAPMCNQHCENSVGLHSSRECNLFYEKRDFINGNIQELLQLLLPIRLWLLKNNDEEICNELEKMEAHLNERRNTPVWFDREKTIVNVFKKFDLDSTNNNKIDKNDETLQRICGIIDVNSFEIRCPGGRLESESNALLLGIFQECQLMAHTCRPNTHITVDEQFRMTVYAAVSIAAGESVTFNYASSLMGTIERQKFLQEGKYFRCECNACKDPLEDGSNLSSILCPRCRKDYIVIQKSNEREPYGQKVKWQCQKCKRIFRGCLIKRTLEISQDLIDQVDCTNYKEMEILLEKLSRTFHKNHYLLLALKQKILVLYRNDITSVNPQRKILQRMIELGKELLEILEIVEPGISRLKGIMLYELHLPIAILANRAYIAREITAKELHSQLEESHGLLKRSLTMLLLEPVNTPEGLLAKRALQEMKILTQNVIDAKVLASDVDSKKQEENRHHGKRKNKVI